MEPLEGFKLESPKISPVTIRLAAHKRQISLEDIGRQIYDNLMDVSKAWSGPVWSCFPFCAEDRPPDQHRSWPRMHDFRDSLVSKLLQTPPSDDDECATIKRELISDLGRRRRMFADGAMELVGDALVRANQLVDDFENGLTASPCRPLSKVDMHYYANVVIRARIQAMLDGDIATGQLVVDTTAGESVVVLDALVAWAVFREVTIEQDMLPGCQPLVHAVYQRVHQRLARPQQRPLSLPKSDDNSVPGTKPRTGNNILAVQVAWQIETTQGRRATSQEVMNRLIDMAADGDRPDILMAPTKDRRGVIWVTNKGEEKEYSVEAVQKTLESWHRSRQADVE